MLANVLRLGWLVCALGLVAGCGGDPQDSGLRDLESLGLVTDQGQDAFGQSYDEIINRLLTGRKGEWVASRVRSSGLPAYPQGRPPPDRKHAR